MTGWQIFLLVIGVLALLLALPVRVWLRYDGQLAVRVSYLFFGATVVPAPPKKEKPESAAKAAKKAQKAAKKEAKKAQKAEKAAAEGEKKSSVDTALEYMDMVPSLLKSLGRAAKFLLRHITVKPLILRLVIAKGDAAETGIAYGKANQVVYTAYALLSQAMRLRRVEIAIKPDFLADEGSVYAEGILRVSPGAVLGAALLLLGSIIWQFVAHKFTRTSSPDRSTVSSAS